MKKELIEYLIKLNPEIDLENIKNKKVKELKAIIDLAKIGIKINYISKGALI